MKHLVCYQREVDKGKFAYVFFADVLISWCFKREALVRGYPYQLRALKSHTLSVRLTQTNSILRSHAETIIDSLLL